jgi:hypothetical protein
MWNIDEDGSLDEAAHFQDLVLQFIELEDEWPHCCL